MKLLRERTETPEDARRVLDYCAQSGMLRWRQSRFASSPTAVAGYKDKEGYVRVSIFGRKEKAHRLAWIIHYGVWPKGQIDHINGIKSDNRIENLRDVDASANQLNRRACRSDNKSASAKGISRHGRQYRARICIQGQKIELGTFLDLSDAVKAREKAEKELCEKEKV